jgi:hypothetical protein
MSKTTIVSLVIGLVIGATGAYFLAPNTPLGGFTDEYNFKQFQGGLTVPFTNYTGTTTIPDEALGGIVEISAASGSVATLPAVKKGGFLRIILGTAFDTTDNVIASAEGDNIYGTLQIGSADGSVDVTPCSGEDQINFVNTAETVGDFVELSSDGTNWYIGANVASSTGGFTCTDPS